MSNAGKASAAQHPSSGQCDCISRPARQLNDSHWAMSGVSIATARTKAMTSSANCPVCGTRIHVDETCPKCIRKTIHPHPMKPKHTPGPWQVARQTSPNNHWYVLAASPHVEGKSQTVCELNGPWNPSNYDANAKLIAAAPELLSSLTATLDALDEVMGRLAKSAPRLLPADVTVEPWKTALRARAAISKATT